jgi:hypothetical protein
MANKPKNPGKPIFIGKRPKPRPGERTNKPVPPGGKKPLPIKPGKPIRPGGPGMKPLPVKPGIGKPISPEQKKYLAEQAAKIKKGKPSSGKQKTALQANLKMKRK